MTDLSEMRRVAEAAQTPWYNDDQDALVEFDHTFDPPTVLALLDVVEALAQDVRALYAFARAHDDGAVSVEWPESLSRLESL